MKKNVIVVPETKDFKMSTSYSNEIYINKNLGIPKLQEKNVNYAAPYWLSGKKRGVRRVYHIKEVQHRPDSTTLILGNSFVLDEIWSDMGNHRRFEYHPLEKFNFVEIKEGILMSYKF